MVSNPVPPNSGGRRGGEPPETPLFGPDRGRGAGSADAQRRASLQPHTEPRSGPKSADNTVAIYVISVAAQLSGLHPQTLRQYDRLGLVSPGRTPGRGRRYSVRDIELLREVQRLSQDEGVNLAGIKRIRELQDEVEVLRAQVAELQASLAVARATTIPVAVPAQQGHPQQGHTAQQTHSQAPAAHPGYRPDLLPAIPAFGYSTALVVWKPQRRH